MRFVDRRFLPFARLGVLLIGMIVMSGALPGLALAGENGSIDEPRLCELIPRLASPSPATRLAAARQLKAYGQSAMNTLDEVYRTGTQDQRRGAVMGLTLLPSPTLCSETLLAALDDTDGPTRSIAAHGLALSGPTAGPALARLMTGNGPRVRDGAAYALSLMGSDAVPTLGTLLKSYDVFVRAKAAWILGRMGEDALPATPALINALRSDDDRLMHVVAEALDLIGPDPAVMVHHLILIGVTTGCPVQRLGNASADTLVALLSRPGTPLGQAAFRALAMIGADAAPALRHTLGKGTPSQQAAAALLLADIDPDAGHALPESIRATLTGAQPEH